MRHGENGGIDYIWMAQQRLFDLGRSDLLPSAIDDVFDPANDEEVRVLVQVAKVTGPEPSALKCGRGSGGIIVVPSGDGRATQRDLSAFTAWELPSFAIQDCDLGSGRLAD
jgi:hypothetical protein